MAPVDGAISGTRYLSSTGMMACDWGVPRLKNRATAPFSISFWAFSAASLGSNLSSIDTSSIFWPLTPPRSLMASRYTFAPSVPSFTPAATGPVKLAVWPMRICAASGPAASARAALSSHERAMGRRVKGGWAIGNLIAGLGELVPLGPSGPAQLRAGDGGSWPASCKGDCRAIGIGPNVVLPLQASGRSGNPRMKSSAPPNPLPLP